MCKDLLFLGLPKFGELFMAYVCVYYDLIKWALVWIERLELSVEFCDVKLETSVSSGAATS